jgi:hypothetical protein
MPARSSRRCSLVRVGFDFFNELRFDATLAEEVTETADEFEHLIIALAGV